MAYQLRMHREIRDWLAGLRETDPGLARLVGEAVLALIDAGEALGPPLVVPLESVLRQPEDPREALDFSYQRQLEILTKVRRGVADVATSRKRVELQAGALEQQTAKLASQREKALRAGRADLADEARARAAGISEQLATLRRHHQVLTGEEDRLTRDSQRLQAKVEAFRIRQETLKASYTAAEGSQTARAAMADLRATMAGLRPEKGDPEEAPEQAPPPESGRMPAAEEELMREVRDLVPGAREGSGPGAVPPPPGMMVLQPGAPGDRRAGLLFVVASEDTAVLLARVGDPGRSPRDYQAAVRVAAERVPSPPGAADDQARAEAVPDDRAADRAAPASVAPAWVGPDEPAEAGAAAGAFLSYGPETFLDEFFPGEETEVEIGAGALVARSRACSLAEARQRMRLTQAQVAQRMQVRQERVSAIERAEPGATEIRTLAAYVGALGGRLEIIAHIGDDRITLR